MRRRHQSRPVAVDVFCGMGGLSEGLRSAGFRVAAAIDSDPLACEAYRINHPRVRLFQRDVRDVTGPILLRRAGVRRGALDLLAGCPPCQGFSAMRTGNGARGNRDPRNRLILHFLRLVRSIRPRAVMFENVPAAARSALFTSFVRSLKRGGYDVSFGVIDAADYGVPQRRRRLVLLASRLGSPELARASFRRRTVRDALGRLPKPTASRDPLHNYKVRRSEKAKLIFRAIPPNGGSRSALPKNMELACHRGHDGHRDVYGRMRWDRPAPTITCGCINPSKGRFLHPRAHRAITLREALLLQSFPACYNLPLSAGRYRAAQLVGNALPPRLIRAQALSLMRAGPDGNRGGNAKRRNAERPEPPRLRNAAES